MRRWLSRLPDGSGRLQHYQTKMTFTLKPHTIAITKLNQPSNSPNAPSHKFRVIMIVVIVVISSGSRAGVILHMKYHLRDFVNYRHPGPRRVWKGGSELQSPPPFPRNNRNCRNNRDPVENSRRLKIIKTHNKRAKNSSVPDLLDPADPAKWCRELQLRPPFHTRRGPG